MDSKIRDLLGECGLSDILTVMQASRFDVRRQGFWDQERPNIRQSLARLVGLIMRLSGGDASVALRVFFA